MDRRHSRRGFTKLTGIVVATLFVAVIIALLQAAPPPRPAARPTGRPAARPAARAAARTHRRAVRRRYRRPLIIRRYGRSVVVAGSGTVVREVAAGVVVAGASDLKPVPPASSTAASAAYRVVGVGSDSTATLDINGDEVAVRLLGVEPALPENAGEADEQRLHAFLANLLAGEFVYVQMDTNLAERDAGGNTVAYLYRAPDKLLVNLELIRRGYALAATDYDYEHRELFSFYESKARADGKGIWKPAAISAKTNK
ncbi:MAG: thermonuclease family protein [Planctomycetota bacterium]|nr:thermonuclease family protein [Planctomycetota bacterium]